MNHLRVALTSGSGLLDFERCFELCFHQLVLIAREASIARQANLNAQGQGWLTQCSHKQLPTQMTARARSSTVRLLEPHYLLHLAAYRELRTESARWLQDRFPNLLVPEDEVRWMLSVVIW